MGDCRVHVGGLQANVTAAELKSLLARCGTVRSAEIMRSEYMQESRGFG